MEPDRFESFRDLIFRVENVSEIDFGFMYPLTGSLITQLIESNEVRNVYGVRFENSQAVRKYLELVRVKQMEVLDFRLSSSGWTDELLSFLEQTDIVNTINCFIRSKHKSVLKDFIQNLRSRSLRKLKVYGQYERFSIDYFFDFFHAFAENTNLNQQFEIDLNTLVGLGRSAVQFLQVMERSIRWKY